LGLKMHFGQKRYAVDNPTLYVTVETQYLLCWGV